MESTWRALGDCTLVHIPRLMRQQQEANRWQVAGGIHRTQTMLAKTTEKQKARNPGQAAWEMSKVGTHSSPVSSFAVGTRVMELARLPRPRYLTSSRTPTPIHDHSAQSQSKNKGRCSCQERPSSSTDKTTSLKYGSAHEASSNCAFCRLQD